MKFMNNNSWTPADDRYERMTYARSGLSGLRLPQISLGLWHNFGLNDYFENARSILHRAFDLGITHFDLANNYGPPPGSAETTFGKILRQDFSAYRDELIVSSKAGYLMWPGPYGQFGSRKSILASADQSLKRLGLDYVDIFYSHRFDPETPLEETMCALDHLVQSGKALYVGISNYSPEQTNEACYILRRLGTPCLIHQVRYSIFARHIEQNLLETLKINGCGCIAFSPLAQGLLTDRYLAGIPDDSRAAKGGFLKPSQITPEILAKAKGLQDIAQRRGQTLSQMALAWVLRDSKVTSALIGASKVSQLDDAVGALEQLNFSSDDLQQIDALS